VLFYGKILDLQKPPHGNISYTINFPGPMMQCINESGTNITNVSSPASFQNGDPLTDMNNFVLQKPIYFYQVTSDHTSITEEISEAFQASILEPCPRSYDIEDKQPQNIEIITVTRPVDRMRCTVATADYTVNITFVNGEQHIEYRTGAKRALPPTNNIAWTHFDISPLAFRLGPLHYWQEYVNILALSRAMTLNMDMLSGEVSDPDLHKYMRNTSLSRLDDNSTEGETCSISFAQITSDLYCKSTRVIVITNENKTD
jgi:hypothetical protein